MDERVSRRIEDVDHIQAKTYFRPDHPAPDPYERTISTCLWKYFVRCWDKAMKTQYYRGEPVDVQNYPCYLLRPGDDGRSSLQRVFKEPYIHVATSELSGEEALTGDVHIKMLDN